MLAVAREKFQGEWNEVPLAAELRARTDELFAGKFSQAAYNCKR
jgi:hypothetical protein